MNSQQKKALAKLVHNSPKWRCSLREFTAFRIGGPADALVVVENMSELQEVLRFVKDNDLSYRVIGRGTNLLVQDEGYPGIILVLSGKFKEYLMHEDNDTVSLEVGAGHGLIKLSTICMENGYSGLEFASGIPGTVGGAVVMNAGAWGGTMGDILKSIDVVSHQGQQTYRKDELHLGYRCMHIPTEDDIVVTSVKIQLKYRDSSEIRATCESYKEQRLMRQPTGLANVGSIFKNPEGDSAGRLIESCGLKGKCIGNAEVSAKHANFIVNRGNATAADVFSLIEYIQKKVKEDRGITLEPEVHVL